MNITKFVKQQIENYKVEMPKSKVNKLISTIRTAGNLPHKVMLDLIAEEVKKYSSQQKTNKGTSGTEDGTFKKIDAAIKSGKCPLCNKQMSSVKLADYSPAKFCTNGCMVALWDNN